MNRSIIHLSAGAIFGLTGALLCAPAVPAELSQPTDKVVLTVEGLIGNTNRNGTAVFDVEMLRSLGSDDIATHTLWTRGTQHFTGVYLSKILESVDATGDTVVVMALNDYHSEIPLDEALKDPALIAFAIDGRELNVREKGPLWLVYPFDSSEKYRTELYYTRSVWQIDRLIIKDAE